MTVDRTPDAAAAPDRLTRAESPLSASSPPTVPRATQPWHDRPWTGRWLALGLGLVAAVVCIWKIATPWPWSDEGATYLALQRTWAEVAVLWQGPDAPIVPYYYLAKAWATLLGWFWPTLSTLMAVRLLSAAAGVATVLVLYALVARNAGRLAGLLAGLLLLTLPTFDRYVQEARPYALLVLAAAISWLAGDRRLRPDRVALGLSSTPPAHDRTGRRYGPVIGHVASLAAVGVVHTFGVFQWPAHVVAWFAAPGDIRTRLRRSAGVLITIAVAALLVGTQLWMTLNHGTGAGRTLSASATTPRAIAGHILLLVSQTSIWPVSALVLILALIGALSRPGGGRQLPIGLLIWLVVPLGLQLALGIIQTNLFRLRYWVAAVPPLAGLAALGIVAAGAATVRLVRGTPPSAARTSSRVAAAVVMAVLLAGQVALTLPQQQRLRAPSGHHQNLSGVFAVLADTRARYPDVRPAITYRSATALLSAADPATLDQNPMSRLRPEIPIVYTTPNSTDEVRREVAGTRYLLWLRMGQRTTSRSQQLPPEFADLHAEVVWARRAVPGWTAVLLKLPA